MLGNVILIEELTENFFRVIRLASNNENRQKCSQIRVRHFQHLKKFKFCIYARSEEEDLLLRSQRKLGFLIFHNSI